MLVLFWRNPNIERVSRLDDHTTKLCAVLVVHMQMLGLVVADPPSENMSTSPNPPRVYALV